MKSAGKVATAHDFVHAPAPAQRLNAYCMVGTAHEDQKLPVANDNGRVSCPKCLKKLHARPQYMNLLYTTRGIDGRGV